MAALQRKKFHWRKRWKNGKSTEHIFYHKIKLNLTFEKNNSQNYNQKKKKEAHSSYALQESAQDLSVMVLLILLNSDQYDLDTMLQLKDNHTAAFAADPGEENGGRQDLARAAE